MASSAPAPSAAALLEEMLDPGGKFEMGLDSFLCGDFQVSMKCFKTGPSTLRDVCDSYFPMHEEKTFIVHGSERLTFGAVRAQVHSLAAALSQEFAVTKGDRVAVAMRNYPEWCISFLATACLGAIVVPINSWWNAEELAYGLADSGTRCLICDEERLRRAAGAIREGSLGSIVVCRETPADRQQELGRLVAELQSWVYSDLIGRYAARSLPAAGIGQDDPATIMYTSGTTSHPKGVVQTHRGVCSCLLVSLAGAHLQSLLRKVPPKEQPCMICPVPLFHVTASHHIFLTSIVLGRKMPLMSKWDPEVALQLIQNERPQAWTGVPTMVQDMMQHSSFDAYDTSSLLFVGGGGAPTPPAQVQRVGAKFRNGFAGQGYGLTETNGAICSISGDEYVKRSGSCGQPFAIVDVAIVDPEASTAARLPAGERGEVLIRSPLVMSHYWNKPEKTAEAVIQLAGEGGGWFRSGDIGYVDSDGFLYICDRAKDIIIRGGENISCSEVETVFYEQDSILECAAFSLQDERLGERVGFAIVLKQAIDDSAKTSTADQIRRAVVAGGKLADFKMPRVEDMFILEDKLPRGATGKIVKRELRDRFDGLAVDRPPQSRL